MGNPEIEEVWEQKTDAMQELAPQEEKRREGLFFRVVSRRADYFADVVDLGQDFAVDDLPTQRYDAFLQSLGLSLVPLSALPTSIPPIEEQPTDPISLADQPTSEMPEISPLLPGFEDQLTATISIKMEAPRESYGAHLGNLLKRSGIYALASMVSPFVALALSPFLTRHLAPADYGALTVLTTAIALAAGVSQLGLGSAFFRVYSYDYESAEDRKSVLLMTLLLLPGCALPLALLECVAAPWLSIMLLGHAWHADSVRVAALVVLLQNLTVPGFAWLRAENRAMFFALLSVANLLINLGMTVLLVGICHLGIVGSLLATGCGYALVLLCTLPPLLLHAGRFRLRLDIARALLAFGLPNAVSFISAWILQLADRFLLAHMRSLSETATYGVAYTLGGALSVVVLSPFSLAWPSTLFLIARRQDARQLFRLIFRWYSLFLLFMAYALSLVAQFVLTICFSTSYHSAEMVIPLVALSTMFYGFYNYLTLGMNICKKLWYAVLFLASAALINIAANFLLIPLYGSLGAALATLIAYALLALETYLLNQRMYPVSFEVGLAGTGLGLIIGCYLLGMLLAQGRSFWAAWTIEVIFLLLCGIGLFVLGWFRTTWGHEHEKKMPLANSSDRQLVRSK